METEDGSRVSFRNVCYITAYLRQCLISGFRHAVVEYCALLGCYAASSGNFLTTTHCVRIQKSAVLILDNVQCLSEVDVMNETYSVENITSLFKFKLRLYICATQRNGLASIKITYIYMYIYIYTHTYIHIQDGARKTGPPSRRPTWAQVSDSVQEIKQMQMQSTCWLEKVLKMISLYVNALLCTLQHIVNSPN